MRFWRLIVSTVLIVAATALAGCSSQTPHRTKTSFMPTKIFGKAKLDPFAGTGSPYFKGKGAVPRGGGRYHVGKPYQVAGRWFTPKEQPGYDRTGTASWYGEAFHRRKTSNGEYFDMTMLSAAHATLPLPSYARVTNLANGRTVIVRINDRGPFVDTRIIDLSKRTAEVLDFKHKGKTQVRVQYIGPAPLDDRGQHLAMMNREMMKGANVAALRQVASGGAVPPQSKRVAVRKTESPEESMPQNVAVVEEQPVAAPPATPLLIKVASFANPENAEVAREELSALGPAQVVVVEGDAGTVYRLQMGPFMSRIGAEDALVAVQNQGFGNARLSRVQVQQVSSN